MLLFHGYSLSLSRLRITPHCFGNSVRGKRRAARLIEAFCGTGVAPRYIYFKLRIIPKHT